MANEKIKQDMLPNEDRIWHILKYGLTHLRIEKRARNNGPPGERDYIEYILTDKRYEDINWDTKDRMK